MRLAPSRPWTACPPQRPPTACTKPATLNHHCATRHLVVNKACDGDDFAEIDSGRTIDVTPKLPKSCSRRAPEVALGDPGQVRCRAEVAKLSSYCQQGEVALGGQIQPKFGQVWPIWARILPCSTKVGPQIAPISTIFGRFGPCVDELRPTLADVWHVAQLRQFGQQLGPNRPTLDDFGEFVAKLGQTCNHHGPTRPDFVEI